MGIGRSARTAISAAALLVMLGGLAACNGDPEPKIADPTTPSGSTSSDPPPSSTPTAPTDPTTEPTTPPASDPPEKESAKDFLRRWQAAGDRMQVTGNASEYRTLNYACVACRMFISAVREIYEEGGYIEFSGSELTELELVAESDKAAKYDTRIRSSATVIHDENGKVTRRAPPESILVRITLIPKGRSWLVTSYSRLAE